MSSQSPMSQAPLQVNAFAQIKGSSEYPSITGMVWFADIPGGMLIEAEISGLPRYKPGSGTVSPVSPFGFHIHNGAQCGSPSTSPPFQASGDHYNPTNQPHGNHAGDLPVLIPTNGYAFMTFYTGKMKSQDIIGKTIIIHENPDDYRTSPAGNSGKKIACGEIQRA
jgi:superoxide dismutase, Cu-Zn family